MIRCPFGGNLTILSLRLTKIDFSLFSSELFALGKRYVPSYIFWDFWGIILAQTTARNFNCSMYILCNGGGDEDDKTTGCGWSVLRLHRIRWQFQLTYTSSYNRPTRLCNGSQEKTLSQHFHSAHEHWTELCINKYFRQFTLFQHTVISWRESAIISHHIF